MGIFSRFEDKMEDTVEGAASHMSKAPINPVQIAKKAEKQMRRETMVGAGKQFAPTLYTVLVNPDDDDRLFGYYPTLAGETETYLSAKATQEGLVMDGNPLVRFIVDDGLRHGKFEVIAEVVAAPIVAQLRQEEMERYGLTPSQGPGRDPRFAGRLEGGAYDGGGEYGSYGESGSYGEYDAREPYDARPAAKPSRRNPQPVREKPPLPYVPEEEIDRSIDYGEYTFNSEDFEDYRDKTPDGVDAPLAYNDPAYGDEGYQDAYQDTYQDAYQDAYQDGYRDAGYQDGMPELAGDYQRANSQPLEGRHSRPLEGRHSQPVNSQPLEGRQRQARPQMQQANTVVFAAGGGAPGTGAGAGASQMPDHRTVRARLIDCVRRRPYDLAGTRLAIGRESGNDIIVADINASRRHAELTLNQQGLWVITDLGSMNGTLVNGISIASQPLYPGDIVTIGKTDYEFALV